MLPVNGYQKEITKQADALMDRVTYDLNRMHAEKIGKYTVLHGLYHSLSLELWQLCQNVDRQAYDKLTNKIDKIDKKLEVFKRTIEFLSLNSDAIDPRICRILGKLEKICKAHGFYGEVERERIRNRIDLCEKDLEHFSDKIECFNENTKNAILNAKELVIKSKNTLDFLLENSKIIHFNDNFNNNYNFNDCGGSKFEIREYHPPKIDIREDKIIISLQKTIEALSLGTKEGYYLAIEEIGHLNEIPFRENEHEVETKGKTLGDRIFFHLYLIHKKESPHLINPSDMNYGSTAFQTKGGCTAMEKSRAAQRVLADILVSGLEHSFRQGDMGIFTQVLDMLEGMKLDARDMPPGIKNLTHGLFGKMYKDYLKAYEQKDCNAGYDSSWVHPHDSVFHSDFGRNAFIGDAYSAVPFDFKLQVIKEFVKSIKENWGI